VSRYGRGNNVRCRAAMRPPRHAYAGNEPPAGCEGVPWEIDRWDDVEEGSSVWRDAGQGAYGLTCITRLTADGVLQKWRDTRRRRTHAGRVGKGGPDPAAFTAGTGGHPFAAVSVPVELLAHFAAFLG